MYDVCTNRDIKWRRIGVEVLQYICLHIRDMGCATEFLFGDLAHFIRDIDTHKRPARR